MTATRDDTRDWSRQNMYEILWKTQRGSPYPGSLLFPCATDCLSALHRNGSLWSYCICIQQSLVLVLGYAVLLYWLWSFQMSWKLLESSRTLTRSCSVWPCLHSCGYSPPQNFYRYEEHNSSRAYIKSNPQAINVVALDSRVHEQGTYGRI